jgi:hypothetical protein
MQEIHTIEQLKAVIEGGFTFLFKNFNNENIICHPIAPVTFIPSNLEIIPSNVRRGIALGWVLLYSNDGRNWTHNFKEVYQNAMNHEGQFYISDWKLNILFNVEYYMMSEVVNLLTTIYDDITLIEGFKWKATEPGLIASYSYQEYFSR